MPPVSRADHHGIQIVALEHLLVKARDRAVRVSVVPVDQFLGPLATI